MNYNYDASNPKSILEYSKKLENKTLNILFKEVKGSYNTQNKGALGHIIEKEFFGYAINSKKEADFSEADMELKVVPIKVVKQNKTAELLIKRLGWSAKERIVLSIIDFNKIISEEWDSTELHHKLDKLLMMFYIHEKHINVRDLEFILSAIWEPLQSDMPYLKKDWELIKSKVSAGKAHELSEGDTLLLGACTKGASRKSTRTQPNSNIPAMQRAYSLKRSYVDHIFNQLYEDNSVRKKTLSLDVYEQIISEFEKIKYHSLEDLFERYSIEVNRSAKQFLYLVTSSLFEALMGITAKEFNENNISEIEIKTILLKNNNVPKEAMSFENIKFDEIIETDWIDSEFRSKFENKKMLWVVFKTKEKFTKQSDLQLKDIKFMDIFYWNMPILDLDGDVKDLWLDTVEKIKRNDFDNFKTSKYTSVAHVRPKAKNGSDRVALASGTVAPKKAFWLNAKYVAKQIELQQKNKGNLLY